MAPRDKIWKGPFYRFGGTVGPLTVSIYNPNHTPDNKAAGLVESQATLSFTCGKPQNEGMWLEVCLEETIRGKRHLTRSITEILPEEFARELHMFLGKQLQAAQEKLSP